MVKQNWAVCLIATLSLCLALAACNESAESYAITSESAVERESETEQAQPTEVWGNPKIRFYRQVAYHSDADTTGWVYRFVYENFKDPAEFKSGFYVFNGYNLRYRFESSRVTDIIQEAGVYRYRVTILPGCQRFGIGNEGEERDLQVLSSFLTEYRPVEEVLAESPEDYEFEVLDKDMVFDLIHEALATDPYEPEQIEALDYPSFAFLQEPDYMDGYKFQISYLSDIGYLGEIYIDVLYQTGDGLTDYVQLSDLVDAGTATAEQKEAFELIQTVRRTLRGQAWYVTGSDLYRGKEIGGIDFDRLYTFLYRIENHQAGDYVLGDEILSQELISE